MRRVLDPFPEVTRAALAPRPVSREIAIESLAQTQDIAMQLISAARRRLWLYSRDFDPQLLATASMLEALKRFSIESRGGELRILLREPTAALRNASSQIGLSPRLSSCILIRVPGEEKDLQYPGAFLLNDCGGFLLRPLGSRYEGTADLYGPGRQRQLREYFEQVWERAVPSPELRPVHI
jgi:hypothetical protein